MNVDFVQGVYQAVSVDAVVGGFEVQQDGCCSSLFVSNVALNGHGKSCESVSG